jgi:hypothetical protein
MVIPSYAQSINAGFAGLNLEVDPDAAGQFPVSERFRIRCVDPRRRRLPNEPSGVLVARLAVFLLSGRQLVPKLSQGIEDLILGGRFVLRSRFGFLRSAALGLKSPAVGRIGSRGRLI